MTTEVESVEDVPIEFADNELIFHQGMKFATWEEIGRRLVRMAEGVMWWLGDWWRFGESRYGEKAAQALPEGYAIQTLRDAARVAERFPPPPEGADAARAASSGRYRRPDLSFRHHRELAPLTPQEAAPLMEQAAPAPGHRQPRLSTRELHHAASRSRRLPEPEEPTAELRLAAACRKAEDDGRDTFAATDRVKVEDVRALLARAQVAADA